VELISEVMAVAYELYENLPRCGPGEKGAKRRAYSALFRAPRAALALEIAYGTGQQTLALSRLSSGPIAA
jgi:tRNA G46 methylase TrmB